MSAERPDMPDDLDQAYVQSHALADDGRAPSAAVRVNVLAAAREIAAQAAVRAEVEAAVRPPLAPVASPVGAVGRGRSWPINLASWQVRSGAALCAALLVGFVGWRFEESRRFDAYQQEASADKAIEVLPVPAQDRQPPHDLPPPYPASSAPLPMPMPPVYVPPPPVDVVEPKKAKTAPNRPAVVVAQAERSDRAADLPPAEGEPRMLFGQLAPSAPASTVIAGLPTAKLVSRASAESSVPAADARAAAAAPPAAALAATPPARAPQIVAADTPPAEPAFTGVQPPQRRVEITGTQPIGSAAVSGALKQSAPVVASSLLGSSAHRMPAPLQDAVDRGDIDALKKLLSDPATLIDSPDAAGRTALLHAVVAQQAVAVRLLVAAGADPDRADRAGLTPRAAAQAGADPAIAALLPAPR